MKQDGGFGAALAGGPLVLDGGLSNQLEAQGCDLTGDLWSARLLKDAPGQLVAAHAAYVRAGARVLITSSYQASHQGFARHGIGRGEAAALFRRSVEAARTAAQETEERMWVAASVGPYGAVCADGGEYRGRYGLSTKELTAFHRPRIEALAEAGPDVLALETVPDADEAEALLRAAAGCGIPVWLSCTVAGGRTRAGQSLGAAFAPAAGNDQVVAIGVNCCDASEADAAIEAAVAVTGKPAVVYPNSGEGWDAQARDWRGAPTFTASAVPPGIPGLRARVEGWTARGARLIGGCCRVVPGTIAGIARCLRRGTSGP